MTLLFLFTSHYYCLVLVIGGRVIIKFIFTAAAVADKKVLTLILEALHQTPPFHTGELIISMNN